ncbi:MAG: acetate--CoA ligase family protein [Actinomycetota bacterium]
MTVASGLQALFEPRGIAVIGASASPGKLGAAMARSLESFPGPLLLVNDRRPDPAAGVHRSVAEAVDATGATIDLAVLCVPAPATAGALADAAAAGVRAALVCAGGFAEAGGPGAAYQADVAAVVAETGLRLLGPNTSGFLAPGRDLVASFVPGAGTIPAGSVSMVAGSGGILHAVAFLLSNAGLGLHLGVGIGNGIDVTAADVLDHLASSGPGRVGNGSSPTRWRNDSAPASPTAGPPGPVALHVEGVTDGRRLAEAVERVAVLAPVVALVVGRNDVGDFARSHTGALTPAWRTARAVLRSAGAVLVDDERELVDALVALDKGRLPADPDPGVGLVTGQAGPAVLFTDRLKTVGVSVPALQQSTTGRLAEVLPAITHQGNPVDTGRPGETFADVLAAVGADPAIDLLATYALLEPGAFDLTAAVSAAAQRLAARRPAAAAPGPPANRSAAPGPPPTRSDGAGPPIVVATGGPPADVADARQALAAIGVAAYDGVAGAVAGVRALVDDARARAARAAAGQPVRLVVPERFELPVGEHEGKRLLAWLGIETPSRVACDDRVDAHAALAELGGPAVVKMLEPVVLHKARVGGVRLGVRSGDDLDAALDALDAAGTRRYLVEETAPPGLDLIVGARRDPVFGPIVLLGLGGDLAQARELVVVRPAPLSEATAAGMLDEILGASGVAGDEPATGTAAGAPAHDCVDRTAVAAAVTSLGALLDAVPDLDEIEVNPLRATPGGRLLALDVVVIGGGAEPGTVDAAADAAALAAGGH